MSKGSEIECNREQNSMQNKLVLLKLGLVQQNGGSHVIGGLPRKRKSVPTPKIKINGGFTSKSHSLAMKKRFSVRLRRSGADAMSDYSVNDDDIYSDEEEKEKPPAKKIKRPNSYGHIEGVEVGEVWLTRLECSNAGIHRPTVAGIHPGHDGAYSIALSGGYAEDVDRGETFTYTGAGGRDLKGTKMNPKNLRTGPQTKHQVLDNNNKSLVTSAQTKNPVRVIRGYKLTSEYAPLEGYRYDGLYTVEKYWTALGTSGFLVYKFALKRCDGQAPPPWAVTEASDSTNTSSHLNDASGVSRSDSHQAIELPNGTAESRIQPVNGTPNQQASYLYENFDHDGGEEVSSVVNKDLNISNGNSSPVSNCVRDRSSRRKTYSLTSSHGIISFKHGVTDSHELSLAEKKCLHNRKCAERTQSDSLTGSERKTKSLINEISRSPNQVNSTPKVVINNDQKPIGKRRSGERKVCESELKDNSSLQDTTTILNGKTFAENSTSYLPKINNCNKLQSPGSPSRQCKCIGECGCLNTTRAEKPVVLLEKMSDEQIETIMSPESPCGSANKVKSKAVVGSSTKFSNVNKVGRHSDETSSLEDNVSKGTKASIRRNSKTKVVTETENDTGNSRPHNSKVKKRCCASLFRCETRNLATTSSDNSQTTNKDKWYGWDGLCGTECCGFNENELIKAIGKYRAFKRCIKSLLGDCDTENKFVNDDDVNWPGWSRKV